ncbi:MAG: alpha/beta hydrolase [Chloroflexi bacterium]|nr:alpha/beta hydrolase [Chloroflexota bacterium]
MKKLIRDGVALAYDEAGSGDPPMLLVHCWTCDHTFLAPQFEYFRRTRRVVTVDLRGHGVSDKPRDAYTVSGFANDLVWLCEQIGVNKPIVVGHSMGGNIALEMAARHSDFATAIVMLDSCIVPPQALVENFKPLAESLRGPGFREASRQIVDSVSLPTDDPARKERIKGVTSSVPQHVSSNAFEQHILLWDGAAVAAACKVPALYIGAATPLADVGRFRQLCPQLVVGQTVGSGHYNNQEVPEQVNAMIERFLAVYVGRPATSIPVASGKPV